MIHPPLRGRLHMVLANLPMTARFRGVQGGDRKEMDLKAGGRFPQLP